MKYNCDVIRDLMPLCTDDSAADDSKRVVFEHMTECRACEDYYHKLLQGFSLEKDSEDQITAEYREIASRYRRRNFRNRLLISILVLSFFLLLLNYAMGYRFTAQAAAVNSGRLNATSEIIGSYDWGDIRFFFYESNTNFDTIAAERHWNGWRSEDLYFVWPKYPADQGGVVVTSAIYYFAYDSGIFILPVLSSDIGVTEITVTAFGQTQTVDVRTGELAVFAFENNDIQMEESAEGCAYGKNGEALYELNYDEDMGRWVWMPAV